MQTAGHVSGAAKLYQASDLGLDPTDKKLFPVCHHPVWGGWFALRGVVIFRGRGAELARREPGGVLGSEEARGLVRMYNNDWKDWKGWREVGRKGERYSDLQMKYFETLPQERFQMIENMIRNPCPGV